MLTLTSRDIVWDRGCHCQRRFPAFLRAAFLFWGCFPAAKCLYLGPTLVPAVGDGGVGRLEFLGVYHPNLLGAGSKFLQ